MAFLASSSNVRLDLSNGGCVLIASCTKLDQVTVRESRLDLNELIFNGFGEFGDDGSGKHFAGSARNIRLEGDNLVCDLITSHVGSWQERKLDLNVRIANRDGELVWIGAPIRAEHSVTESFTLPNVRASNADNLQHLWAAIDTSGHAVLSGTFVTNVGQKFFQKPFKLDSNTYVFGAREGGWFKMRAVDANKNVLPESKHIWHTTLDNLSNLTADLWNDAKVASVDYYNVIDVDVDVAEAYTAKVRITRPLSIGTGEGFESGSHGIHHLHINNVEAYDQAGAKLKLHYNGNASNQVKNTTARPDLAIDGDGTTGNVSTMSHSQSGSMSDEPAIYGIEDHWMEFDVSGGKPARIFIRNNHVSERLAGATLAVLTVGGSVHEEFSLSECKLQEHVLSDPASLPAGVTASLELTWISVPAPGVRSPSSSGLNTAPWWDPSWAMRSTGTRSYSATMLRGRPRLWEAGHIYARKDGGAWEGISPEAALYEETRESFEIPAKLLGGKLELGYSVQAVGCTGGHRLIIKAAAVEITTKHR